MSHQTGPRRGLHIAHLLVLVFTVALTSCDSVAPDIDGKKNVSDFLVEARSLSVSADNAVLIWGEACLQAVRDTKQGPPMTGRSLALVHTAMYDAWAAYDEVAVGTRLGGTLRRPAAEHTMINKEAAISFAAFRTLVDLFPSQTNVFVALMESLGYDPDDLGTDPATPAGIGNLAAEALLAFRHQDGSNQLNGYADLTGYVSVNEPFDPDLPGIPGLNDPNKWQPLIHNGVTQRWIIPHWKDVVPFALTSSEQFLPRPPADVKSGEFHRQVQEVINIQAELTDRQKVIAEYWADGPTSEFPPGHWCTIAQYVSERNGFTLDEDVKLFFLVANAVHDAAIGAWAAKIRYDYVRPVSAVRYLKQGKKVRAWAGPGMGTRVLDGEAWVPYQTPNFKTPPFAEYVSGHSTFSSASATVLKLFQGSDEYGACATFPPGWSKVEPGIAPENEVELCWDTFTAAAEEAGMSRLYGGIHFRQANEEGLAMGRKIGQQVFEKAQEYFQGTITSELASN